MTCLFVSYRRADAPAQAGRIADRLRAHPSRPEVFFDRSTLRPGDRWRERIDDALARCETMVVVIGPRWLDAGPDGRPRLHADDDMVAYEIDAALARGIRCIPLRVDGVAALPDAAALPPALRPLVGMQDHELRDGAFDRDFEALEQAVLPAPAPPPATPPPVLPPPPPPPGAAGAPRALVAGLALALLLAAGGAAIWGWTQRDGADRSVGPAPPAPAAWPRHAVVDLRVVPHPLIDEARFPAQRMEFVPMVPLKKSSNVLQRRSAAADGAFEYRIEGFELPPPGAVFVGQLGRDTPHGVQVDEALAGVFTTPVCLQMAGADKVPPAAARLAVRCREGRGCAPDGDDAGLVSACGATPRSGRWHDPLQRLFASAHAQAGGVGAAREPQLAAGDWLVPRLATLEAGRERPGATAYSVVALRSDPLPDLAAADELAWALRINGHRIWTNGLPAWAHAVPFDARRGVELRFGLENLDASGADAGFERLEVTLLFLRRKETLHSVALQLPFVALRRIEETPLPGSLPGLRWQASYHPAPADRFQIFLTSSRDVAALLRVKGTLDGRPLPGDAGVAVGIVRPPNRGNPSHGLAFGLRQPNGQVQWSFSDAHSRRLCRTLLDWRGARAHGLAPAGFYRREIAVADGDDSRPKPIDRCSSFGPP